MCYNPLMTTSLQIRAKALLELKRRENLNLDPIEWITSNFYIPELKGPIELYPYQIAALREACRVDDAGKFIYNVVVWSDIKKSAKSCIAAAIALYRAIYTGWGSIKVVANDLKQADSRVAFYLRRAITLNPDLDTVRQSGYTTSFPNNSTIEAIPIDPAGEAGGNDDLIIFSELWAAKHKAMIQMWTEMTLSPTKFGYSQRWVETYAGYEGESPILEQLYRKGVMEGDQLDLSYDGHNLANLEVYANEDMLCLWNTTPRLPWQTNEYYASEEKVLVPNEFNRVHRNQWGSSTEKFVQMVWWDACQELLPSLGKKESAIIGMDAAKGSSSQSYVADCFSIVLVTRHPSRPKDVAVRYCGIWQPAKGALLDFAPIEAELMRLCQEFSVIEVAYDPHQLHDMATRLGHQQWSLFKEFKQGIDRLQADKALQDLIIGKRISHDGNPLLRSHIDNANAKTAPGDKKGIRLEKRSDVHKIDAAVALSMAAARILYYNL